MTQARIIAYGWPASMKRATAAQYCDMSEAAFEREIIAGRLPAGVIFGGREHWSRDAIDRALVALTGTGNEPDYIREMKERYGKAA